MATRTVKGRGSECRCTNTVTLSSRDGVACGSNAWPEMCAYYTALISAVSAGWEDPERSLLALSFHLSMFLHDLWVFAPEYLLIVPPHIYEDLSNSSRMWSYSQLA